MPGPEEGLGCQVLRGLDILKAGSDVAVHPPKTLGVERFEVLELETIHEKNQGDGKR